MYSKFPFPISMENIPRQRGVCCVSLRVAAVLTALVAILYSLFGLAESSAALGFISPQASAEEEFSMLMLGAVISRTISHAITFILSAVLLVGTIKKSLQLMKPWVVWSSVQVTVFIIIFVFCVAVNSAHGAGEDSLLIYLVTFLILVIRIYMLILVSSYYRQLEEEQDESERLKQLISKDIWYGQA